MAYYKKLAPVVTIEEYSSELEKFDLVIF